MRVTTRNGVTECKFEDFAAVEPALIPIRDAFRAKQIKEDEVLRKVRGLVGMARFHRDFDAFFEGERRDFGYNVGYPSEAIQRWQDHVEENKLHKLYYSHEVIAGTITQEEE
jgi:hypothetical protein